MSQLQKASKSTLSTVGTAIASEPNFKPYDVRITRERPACFVFLIDQSGSMSDRWGSDQSKSKAELVALYVNNAINEITNICQKTEPEPLHYFDICVIGYGQRNSPPKVMWEGKLADKIFVSPADLKRNPTGLGGEIEQERRTFKGVSMVKIKVPFWFEPVAEGLTPMGEAFDLCTEVIEDWTSNHKNCLPPIVINITDGDQTDCTDEELIQKAAEIKNVQTLYGNTLLFNAHISNSDSEQVLFPSSRAQVATNDRSALLYDISSTLPEIFKRRIATEIKKEDISEQTEYVAMTYQASIGDLTRFLDIGTRTIKPS